ncbi:hypothetical protein A2U01_0013245 [Trifolium medium]|uniref:Uncharacterized protein n=1 Tax=Trifolium medium TaxID=97028 RepID=A0A392N024_9FABA|nr:hypothetical protein [Trifolium medium]MCH92308.1 hypothetical protein [Trifolium medium]
MIYIIGAPPTRWLCPIPLTVGEFRMSSEETSGQYQNSLLLPTKSNNSFDSTCWGVRRSSEETLGQMLKDYNRGRRLHLKS